jgi:hypothetical protein
LTEPPGRTPNPYLEHQAEHHIVALASMPTPMCGLNLLVLRTCSIRIDVRGIARTQGSPKGRSMPESRARILNPEPRLKSPDLGWGWAFSVAIVGVVGVWTCAVPVLRQRLSSMCGTGPCELRSNARCQFKPAPLAGGASRYTEGTSIMCAVKGGVSTLGANSTRCAMPCHAVTGHAVNLRSGSAPVTIPVSLHRSLSDSCQTVYPLCACMVPVL